jgi:phosphoesterase RecJ-like protein
MSAFYPQYTEIFGRILQRLAGQRVAVIGHARPDGDCIGSQVALARGLAARGIDVVCINGDPVPRRLQYLVADTPFLRTDAEIAGHLDRLAVYVDCADQARVGDRLKAKFPQVVACIDHHLSNVGFAEFNLVDPASAATCEMLAGLMLDAGVPVDRAAAKALYAGVMTDTGQFRFHSTSQRCFVLAGELVARGASPAEAGHELYERESHGRLKLLQRFLASMRLECGGKVCVGFLPLGIFAETGTNGEDTEGLVDYARSIDGVEVGVLIEDKPDGGVKASLRAKDPAWRLDRIAAQFNGGGHACAAGLNHPEGLAHFYPRLIAALARQIEAVGAVPPAP